MLRHVSAIMVFGFSAFCVSAASAQPPSSFTACKQKARATQLAPIYFATDRPPAARVNGHARFRDDRPEFNGLVNSDPYANPTSHEIIYGTIDDAGEPQVTETFERSALTSRVVESARQADSDVVVYVHGYNTSFQGAAQGAQLLRLGLSCATNFKRNIVVVFFSWPSAARLGKPTDDEVRAEWAYRDFQIFMDTMYAMRSPERVPYAVAHSMGNRFLMQEIDRCPRTQCFRRVAFVAPDVDARLFADVIAAHPTVAEQYTLYVSSRDKALWLSERFHGETRAGQGGREMLRFGIPNVDTVDASYMQAESLCHAYIDRPAVLYDIAKTFYGDLVPDAPTRFKAERATAGGAHYFEIVENENSRVKAACVGSPLRFQRY